MVEVELRLPGGAISHQARQVFDIHRVLEALALVLGEYLLPCEPFRAKELHRVPVDGFRHSRSCLEIILRAVWPAGVVEHLNLHELYGVTRQMESVCGDDVAKLADRAKFIRERVQ